MNYTYKQTISTSPKYSVWDHNNHLTGYTNNKGFIEYDESGTLLSSPRKLENNSDHQLKTEKIF